MLKRLLGLTLLAAALLVLLVLFAAQAEAPYVPLSALPFRQAALPPEKQHSALMDAGSTRAGDAAAISLTSAASMPAPEPPQARAAYHRRCYPAFHYSDRAG